MDLIIMMFLLSFAVSFDSFFFGLTFQIRSITIRVPTILLIGLVTGVSFLIGSWLGNFFQYVFPYISEVLGGTIFIMIGLWVIWQWVTDQREKLKALESNFSLRNLWTVLRKPQHADADHSGSINGAEAFVIALALSMDSLASGLGSSLIALPIYLLSLLIGLFSIIFLYAGTLVGRWLQHMTSVQLLGVLPGMILIGIGIFNLV